MKVFQLFGEISIDKSGAIVGIKQVEKQASKSSVAMQKTFNKLAKVAKVAMIAGAVAATAAIVKMTKDSIKAFAEFEEGMNEVFTLLPDITEEAMDSMKEDVKSLAKEMGILPDEIVPALYQAISAGIPAENVFDFMRVASTAAIGGVTDLETAVDGLTSIINAYGKENMTAREAADILFTAVRLGKTTMEELSDRLFQVNPIAAALGVKFEDVAAAMAEITAAGVPTRVAATQLRQMFMELSKAGSDVAVTFEAIAGESFQDFIASGHNVGDALQLLTDYAEENDIKMQDMFGSVEAGQAVLALTGTHLDSYTDKIGEMANAAGATDAAHAKMEGGLKRTWAKIQAWWATVKIDLGEKLQAPLERLMDWLDENREKIEDGIMAIFDKLIEGAMWLMDHADWVARGLKAIAIGFAAIVAIKFGLWIAPVITGIAKLTLAIGTKVGLGAGLIGALGVLGTTLAATGAIILAYNQKIDAGAESTSEMANATEDLMLLAWSGLHSDLLDIADASGVTAEDLRALQTEIDAAYLAATQAPDPATASALYTEYVDAILAVWQEHFPELGALREKWFGTFEAMDQQVAADRVALEQATQDEVVEIVEDAGEKIVAVIEEEEIAVYSLGDVWEDFGVSLKRTFESSILKFFRMFRDNTITLGSIITDFVDDAIREVERLAAKWVAENVWGWLTGTTGGAIDLSSLDVVWTWLGTAFGNVATWLGTFGGSILSTIGAFLGSGGLLPAIGIAAGAILLLSGALDPLFRAFGSLTGTILNAVIPGLGDFVGTLWSGITGFFSGIWDWLFGGGGGEAPAAPAPSEEVLRGAISSMLERIIASTDATVSRLASEIFTLQEQAGRTLGTGSTAYAYLGMSARAAEADMQARAASRIRTALGSFAEGGLVMSPILSLIGEGLQKEAVLPLSKPVFRELGMGIVEALTGIITPQPALAVAGGGNVYVTIESATIREEADIRKVAVQIVELTEEERRSQGRDALIGG